MGGTRWEYGGQVAILRSVKEGQGRRSPWEGEIWAMTWRGWESEPCRYL